MMVSLLLKNTKTWTKEHQDLFFSKLGRLIKEYNSEIDGYAEAHLFTDEEALELIKKMEQNDKT